MRILVTVCLVALAWPASVDARELRWSDDTRSDLERSASRRRTVAAALILPGLVTLTLGVVWNASLEEPEECNEAALLFVGGACASAEAAYAMEETTSIVAILTGAGASIAGLVVLLTAIRADARAAQAVAWRLLVEPTAGGLVGGVRLTLR